MESKERYSTVDHKISRTKGGARIKGNLVMACNICNSVKGSKTTGEFLAWLILEGERKGAAELWKNVGLRLSQPTCPEI
jgi:5-methylcytosine-specific restriction endonuclease McrA